MRVSQDPRPRQRKSAEEGKGALRDSSVPSRERYSLTSVCLSSILTVLKNNALSYVPLAIASLSLFLFCTYINDIFKKLKKYHLNIIK